MIFRIVRASDYCDPKEPPVAGASKDGDEWVIAIDTLEDLMALRDAAGHDLIVSRRDIWIYDAYLE